MGSSATLSDLGFSDEKPSAPAKSSNLADLGFEDETPAKTAAVSTSAAPAKPMSPSAAVTPDRPAGLPAGVNLPGVSAHASAPESMKDYDHVYAPHPEAGMGFAITPTTEEGSQQFLKGAVQGPVDLVKGAAHAFLPSVADEKASPYSYYNQRRASAGLKMETPTKQESNDAQAQVLRGAGELVSGAGSTLMAVDAPGVANIFSKALAGDVGAGVAVSKIVGGYAAGAGASYGAGKGADALHLTPEAKDLAQAAAFWLPGPIVGHFIKEGFRESADGSTQAYAAGTKNGYGVAVGKTPGEVGAEVRYGTNPDGSPRSVRVSVARPAPPPDAATVTAKNMLDQGMDTMRQAQQADAAAEAIVKGATPEQAVAAQQPKGPDFTPDDMKQGHLSEATVANAAQVIRMVPEAQRPQAVMEAHGKLADWMAKQGKFVGPDGQVQVVKTPEQAQQLAAKLINETVAAHDTAAAEAQKPAEPEAAGKSKLKKGAEDQQYQRAKTLLDANPEHPDPTALLGRNLGLAPDAATAMVQRVKAHQAANVGSAKERVVEEKPETIDAQMDALRAGTIKAVMLPEGSGYEPKLGPGMKKVVVSGDAPGAGTYIIKGISPDTVKEAAKAGTHGDLLGHVQTKDELAGTETAAVVASKPNGTEIQASEVNNPAAAQAQVDIMAERHPGAKIEIKPVDDVVGARLEQKPEDVGFQDETPAAENAQTAERRMDEPTRKRVDEMSPEEMRRELMTSAKTELPNKRAYEEAEQAGKAPVVGISDADGLKAVNDRYGYEAGDELLRAKAEALKQAGVEAYHDKGDEFLYRDKDADGLQTKLEKAREILRDRIIDVKKVDGEMVSFKGADFSYGVGKDGHGAEAGLKQHKADREARGERARGELRGITEVGPKDGAEHEGAAAEDTAAINYREENEQGGLKRYQELSGLAEPRDQALHRALHSIDGAAEHWKELDKAGATDEQMQAAIAREFGEKGISSYPVPHSVRGGKNPALWRDEAFGSKDKKPLKGKELIQEARRVLGIREPVAEGQSDTEGGNLTKSREIAPEKVANNLTPEKKSSEGTAYTLGAQINGHDGRKTSIKTPVEEFKSLPGRYRVVDAADLVPSHDAHSFQLNPKYPKGVQERDYEKDDAKHRVISQAQNLDPDYLLNTNPDAVNGPPITTPDGTVLGGNSRVMTLLRAYKDGAAGKLYRSALLKHAEDFGVGKGRLLTMKQPVLVREIDAPRTLEEMERIGSALNKNMTGALSPSEKAVSAGRKITPETMNEISRLVDKTGDDASIRKMLAEHGPEALQLLEDSGALTTREAAGYRDGGKLSEAGKEFIERALLGSIVGDSKVMDAVPPSILNKLDGALAAVSSFSVGHDEYDIVPAIRDALDQHAEVAKRQTNVATFQDQSGLMEQRKVNPVVDAIARKLADKPTAVKKALRAFAEDAKDARKGQGLLLGGAKEPVDSFNEWFGSKLSEQEYRHGIAGSVSEQDPRAAESRREAGVEGVSRGEAGRGEGEGQGSSLERGTGKPAEGNSAEVATFTPPATGKPESLPVPEPGTKPVPAANSLPELLHGEIAAGRMPKDNIALRKLVERFDGKPADQARLKQAQEAMEEALVQRSREIVASTGDTRATFDKLLELYESQPNLNIRTSTSIENQAYSTPAPLAFLAGKLAGIGKGISVYEPAAGNGMLLISADPKHVYANELDGSRATALERQNLQVTKEDASKGLPEGVPKVDAVITNPPFGSVKGADGKTAKVPVDGYKVGQIDHLIAARALDAMKDDGRATLILGAQKITGGLSSDDRVFFNWLYSHYNVASQFELDGKLYARQGANWPVRVITIDGRERSDRFSPAEGEIERAGSWKEVYERFSRDVATIESRDRTSGTGGAVQRSGDAPAEVRGAAAGTDRGIDRARPAGSKRAADRKPREQPQPLPGSDVESAAGLARTDSDVRPDADASRSDRLAKGGQPDKTAGKRDAQLAGTGGSDLAPADNAFQVHYTPSSRKKDKGVLIPVNMRDPLVHAMHVLEDRVGDIDEYAAKKLGYETVDDLHNALMGLQVDSVAAAIDNIERGLGMIIADQTGIGKGRQLAAIQRYAIKAGKTPIFMTVKPTLFTDMYGDLADIGTDDVRPFIVNAEESISLPNGTTVFGNKKSTHALRLQGIRDTGKLPEDRNAIFMTYSQISKSNSAMERDLLQTMAPNAIFVLDESHAVAGASKSGEFMQELLQDAHGVIFSSATYAKRPDNMALYARTNIGLAIQDKTKLETAFAQGGLALQTVSANNLVKDGQNFRRERSFDGVNFREITATDRSKEHRILADKATEALRAIAAADRSFHDLTVKDLQKEAKGEMVMSGGNKAAASVSHTEFSSVVHNSVRQLVLALKAPVALDRALAAIRAGEKPILAVEHTMGSFLKEFVAENNLKDGDPLKDFTFKNVLLKALERSRAIQKKDQLGNTTKIPIPMSRLHDETRLLYRKAEAIINGLDADLPISPIDFIRQGLKDAGYSMAEITGRDLAVDYSDRQNPKLTRVPEEELSNRGKVETTRRFNDGRLDGILLNVAGSTGISLHASEKFKDQRKRRMIVAQAAQDINIFMQMLGRPHRTGQVRTPDYDLLSLDLPAEKRPNAMLSKKLKSLNANTSSNTESATSVKAQDILNKYGDEVVASYLVDNPGLADTLDVEPMGESGKPTEDIARKATGRLAIMPVKVQEEFYREVEQQYSTYIDYLNDTNQNDLEPRTFDFAAKEMKTAVLAKGSNPESAFGQDAIYGEYSIKAQSKPLTAADVNGAIGKSLAGKTATAHLTEMIGNLDGQYKSWQESLDPQLASTAHAAIARESAINFLRGHAIGSSLRAEINGEVFNAVVTNIENTHKGSGNPFSMSKINVTLATTGPQPNIKVPATQVMRVSVARLHESANSIFAFHRPPARETAKIVTGNILGAYGELKDTKGTIINFTREDGTVEQGILLPKKFDLKTNTMGDHLLETPGQVEKFLRGYSKPDEMQVIGVASRDQDVRVVVGKGGKLEIQTPKAKARGAKFYLDKAITAITGDFVSSGQTMKATVPAGKEKAALGALLKKTSLYASRSMAEEAQKLIAAPAKPSSGTTLHASVFGADIVAKALGSVVKRAWDADVAPHLPGLGANIKEVSNSIVNTLVPSYHANRDVLDALMKLKGDQERAMFHLDNTFAGIESMFDGLPEQEHIDFLDRYKRGEDQKTPELQKIAEMYKALDTATYQRIVDAQVGGMDRPTRRIWDRMGKAEREDFYDELSSTKSFEQAGDRELARDTSATADERKDAKQRLVLQRIANGVLSFKANHLRAFWKVIPGTLEEKNTKRGVKSPLRGDRGFTKRSTLPDVSSGIADGGVLETTNPQKMVEMGQKSSLRYITALNMWKEIGDLGMRKFVPMGERAPDGWEKINDAIAKVYYPVRILTDDYAKLPNVLEKSELGTREAIVQGGEWYVEQSSARLLNNYLSKNWFDANAIGRGLMKYKNITTGIELSLSPFHAFFEGLESISSQLGLGMMHAWNNGVRYGDGTAFLEGLKTMATAPAAPVTSAMLGGKAVKMEKQEFEAFAADPVNQQFLKAFPDAPHLVDLLFTGGITMAQPREYRVDLMKNAKQAMNEGNYLGAFARAVPGVANTVMKPMFETWIPRLKMGFAMQALAHQIAENHDALVRGDITREQIARSVVSSAENRFGELNFSNLWWNNTFKGATQLAFRSVTWKLGNWRGAGAGVAGQAKAFADPLRTMYEDAKGYRKGTDRQAHEYIPKLDLNMTWLLGIATTLAVGGAILSRLLSGKEAWEWVDEDKKRGMSAPGALLMELVHPRSGGTDAYTGLPSRLSMPTGFRDFEHAFSDPKGYAHGSLSSFAGKAIDSMENRDYFGNYIYDPEAPAYKKMARLLAYNAPLPIGLQQYMQGKKSGDYSALELSLAGLAKAPKGVGQTRLEAHMEAIAAEKHIPQTPEEREAYHEKMAAALDGGLSAKERKQALHEYKKPYLIRLFSKLNYTEAKKAMEMATPDEKAMLRSALLRKAAYARTHGRTPEVFRPASQ